MSLGYGALGTLALGSGLELGQQVFTLAPGIEVNLAYDVDNERIQLLAAAIEVDTAPTTIRGVATLISLCMDPQRTRFTVDMGYDVTVTNQNTPRLVKRRRESTLLEITYHKVTKEERDLAMEYFNSTKGNGEIPILYQNLLVLGSIASNVRDTRITTNIYELQLSVAAFQENIQAVA